MTYYAQYNRLTNELSKAQVKCLNEEFINIEISENVYNNIEKYIYQEGGILINPDYEMEQAKKERERRNQEINQKISELEQMAISDVLQGNKENVNTYNQVIASLRENLVMNY